ncbi:MAG: recombinase family protein [Lachnospiraceae bacterium]|nr:recombinase family protein [Lachnospiraceae bacterium]
MKGSLYGYVRASTDSRDTERQMIALWDFGVAPENVFAEASTASVEAQVCRMDAVDAQSSTVAGKNGVEAVSGGKQNSKGAGSAYQAMLKTLKENDTLVITSLDVLGSDCYELMDRWRYITIGKKAGIIVLELPLLNTGIEEDVLGKVVARITLGVMQHFDQSRQYKRRRQAEGIARARQKGVPLGRKPKEIPREFESVRLRWDRGELSARSAADILGVDAGTFRKWVKTGVSENENRKYAETGTGKSGDG